MSETRISASLEKQTEWIMSNILANKGWHMNGDASQKNVFQAPIYSGSAYLQHLNKLKGKPDYILCQIGTQKPLAIIEIKKSGADLQETLRQGIEYAKVLNIPLVFAMNGIYCETCFVPNGKSLFLNGNEVKQLIRESEVLKFVEENSNDVYTIPSNIVASRDSLMTIFKNLNYILKSEGLRAGIERFNEFANILFLKLLSENHRHSCHRHLCRRHSCHGHACLQKSWWESIKAQSNEGVIGYINGSVMQEIQGKYGNDVFTPLLIKNPETLRHIIDSLDPLMLSTVDSDVKGDAFEYFLAQTSSTENDLGEYFTPRNVVKSVVNLVDPKLQETIYDPFCGTGGFLTGVVQHMKENHAAEGTLDTLKQNMLFGREITTTARIAKMNMILQGFGHKGIQQMDSLANPDYIGKGNKPLKFDVIVTNMPFSQPIARKVLAENGKIKTENHISPLYYNGIAKNSGDAACVLHCLRNLKEGGRMALVVPEGFLFRTDLANVRAFLLSKAKLHAVISLPQGTFLPYTRVKTDILYFTNAHKPNNQKEYWFFDVKNTGVTLDNHKKKISGMNDFDTIDASDLKRPRTDATRVGNNPDSKTHMLEMGFKIIDLNKVKDDHYNLARSVHGDVRENGVYKSIKLGNKDYFEIVSGDTPSKDNAEYWENGNINWATLTDLPSFHGINKVSNTNRKITERGLKHSGAKLLPVGSVMVSTRATIGKVGIVTEKELATNRGFSNIIIKKSEIMPEYLAYVIKLQKEKLESLAKGTAFPGISKSDLETIEIPLPSLEIQRKIIQELDNRRPSINNGEDFIESFNRQGEYGFGDASNRNLKAIQDFCDINPPRTKLDKNLPVSFVDMATLPINGYKFDHHEIRPVKDVERDYRQFKENDVLLAKIATSFENGKCGIAVNLKNQYGFGSTELVVLRAGKNILPEYLYGQVSSEEFRNAGKCFMRGTGPQRVPLDFIKNYKIPIVTIDQQKKIIAEWEGGHKLAANHSGGQKLKSKRDNLTSTWEQSAIKAHSVKLGEICTIVIGGTPSRKDSSFYGDNNLWVKIRDIKQRYVIDTEEKITDAGVANSNVKLLPKGTLLFSFKLTIGKVAFAARELYTNEGIAGLIPKDNRVLSKYLYYLLPRLDYLPYIHNTAKGKMLNKASMESIEIPLPSLESQERFIQELETKEDEKENLLKKAANLTEIQNDKITEFIAKARWVI